MLSARPESLLLDTHAWVRIFNADPRLAKRPCRALVDRLSDEGRLLVSAITIWEVGMLHSKGRLTLPGDPLDWVRNALKAPGLSLVPISPEIAIESTRLPAIDALHADPADRILAATARSLRAAILTHDAGLLHYAKLGFIDAIPL